MEIKEIFENFKTVYDFLEDEESKEIYKSCILYRCLGEVKYFRESTDYIFSTRGKYYFFEDLEQNKHGKIILFGAGLGARIIIELFESLGIKIAYCVDNDINKWNTSLCGIPVMSPEKLTKDNEKKYLIISSPSPRYSKEMLAQIIEMGICRKDVFTSFEVLGDIYCDTKILKVTKEDVLVDGGCFDGANAIEINELVEGGIKKIYAFEPDTTNLELCKESLRSLPNVQLINAGIYSHSGVVYFDSDMGGSSSITDKGDTSIKVFKIDDVADDVTFIKMDIEGSELEALKGAKDNILKNKPKIAISIYHKPEDLIELPMFLKKLVPEYKLYLRQHTMTYADCVLYATI